MIKFENVKNNLCVICDNTLDNVGGPICLNCNQRCEINIPDNLPEGYVSFDAKSKCCNSDFEINTKTTCSEKCHDIFINECEKLFGKFKKVVGPSGVDRMIPTKDIIEKSISGSEIDNYPVWKD